ncbi:MAG TPA: diguanylate cyclase [Dehalococcoidia bacterium]|nr:diguanylate cyclase [Dehalococcoidia bacterium]
MRVLKKTRSEPGSSVSAAIASLCDQLADSVYIMDADGVIRYANSAFEEMTGYTPAEAVGKSATILASGSHPEAVFAGMWEMLRASGSFRFVFTNRKRDGSLYDEGVMISPIHDAETGQDFYVHMGRLIKFTRQTHDVFTILANSAPAGIYLERDGILYFVNERFASLLGRPAAELVGSAWGQYVVDEDREQVIDYVRKSQKTGSSPALPVECRIETPNDGIRWIMASVQPIVLTGPAAVSGPFSTGYVVDITARKLAEERLRNAMSIQAATLESTTDGIVVINRAREIVSHNHRFAELWRIEDVPTMTAERTRAALNERLKDADGFRRVMEETSADPTAEKSGSVELRDGRFLEFYSKPPIVDGEVAGRVWSWRDVTERRRFESALLRLANYDSLTGLMNRRKIQEELDACLAETEHARGALLLLDLDGFKEVNDTLGHQAGDEVLVQVARVLADSGTGDMVGRFGGDEFAILLPGVTPPQAMQMANRTLHHLSGNDYVATGHHVSLTSSMGVAFYPAHATTSDELLSAADLALYEAKSYKHSSLRVYSPRLKRQSRLLTRGHWQTQLRNAISKSQGKLYAEKTLPLHAGLPVIYRLTIRMTGSRSQVLSSRDIGTLAQQASLSVALDRWLLREAIALARRPSFISAGAGLSFELSVDSLAHPDVLRRLLDLGAVRAAHTTPLILELTGLDAMAGAEGSIETLRSAGYRFEVTESSNSALAQILTALPIDCLKLDSALVRELRENPSLDVLIGGTVHMARGLGAVVVADGVPEEASLTKLKSLGLDYARGPAVGLARSANAVFRTTTRRLRAA